MSGFPAVSKNAALQLIIVSPLSYSIEILSQGVGKQLAITFVPAAANTVARKFRLFRNIQHFVSQSVGTTVRRDAMYNPLSTFFRVASIVGVCFLYFHAVGHGARRIQPLGLGGALVVIGFMILLIGLVADLINFNRQLIETTVEKVKHLETSAPPAREVETERPGV